MSKSLRIKQIVKKICEIIISSYILLNLIYFIIKCIVFMVSDDVCYQ